MAFLRRWEKKNFLGWSCIGDFEGRAWSLKPEKMKYDFNPKEHQDSVDCLGDFREVVPQNHLVSPGRFCLHLLFRRIQLKFHCHFLYLGNIRTLSLESSSPNNYFLHLKMKTEKCPGVARPDRKSVFACENLEYFHARSLVFRPFEAIWSLSSISKRY